MASPTYREKWQNRVSKEDREREDRRYTMHVNVVRVSKSPFANWHIFNSLAVSKTSLNIWINTIDWIDKRNESSRTKKWEISKISSSVRTNVMISWYVHDNSAWENHIQREKEGRRFSIFSRCARQCVLITRRFACALSLWVSENLTVSIALKLFSFYFLLYFFCHSKREEERATV